MNIRHRLAVIAIGLLACAGPVSAAPLSKVVTPAWIDARRNDPNLVVVQVSWNRREYTNGHIPGAVFLWPDWVAPSNPDYSTELPPVEDLKDRLEKLGIGDNSTIVLYGVGSQMTMTTRVFFTLDYFGLGERTYILDGGLGAWTAEKRELSTDTPGERRGSLTPRVDRGKMVDAAWIGEHGREPGVKVIDARAEQFYNGTGGGAHRPGHIPGAASLPYSTLADSTNRYKDVDTLRAYFTKAGLKPGDKVVSYCHVGQQATQVYFVARCLGYNAAVYDGSFEDWSGRKELPVELPPKPETRK